jgi:NAD(P)-dependent dehydrogenase (short-subunit alcohol dehydrogenase family)
MNIRGDAVDVRPEDFDRVLSANLRSTDFTSRAAGRVMI